jgi:hypothetical protein
MSIERDVSIQVVQGAPPSSSGVVMFEGEEELRRVFQKFSHAFGDISCRSNTGGSSCATIVKGSLVRLWEECCCGPLIPMVPDRRQSIKPMAFATCFCRTSAILGWKTCMKGGDHHHQAALASRSLADVGRMWRNVPCMGWEMSQFLQALPAPYLRCNGS